MRFLGIDYGTKRIGLALSDPDGKVALPYKILKNDKAIFENLLLIIKQENVKGIVLGLPQDLQGRDTAITQAVRNFSDVIKEKIKIPPSLPCATSKARGGTRLRKGGEIPLYFEKEFLTSKMLEPLSRNQIRESQKMYHKKPLVKSFKKTPRDDRSAALILQSFLDRTIIP